MQGIDHRRIRNMISVWQQELGASQIWRTDIALS